ncbi:Ferric-chelate reductase 1 [Chlorella sorokiniana]|uniref:Ferric-chelate reductase 1 n=1 Tax=Chlorella sorokiniana TaxID=3076 RepID=A0A2P6U1N0_CHLSO|nr:Ferric-chelate reductase 1 [Chlorella sorokiniana]|eukprot:PRW60222.1 Ferric-chelate reductase 1 [Chlorella sorokiniana]
MRFLLAAALLLLWQLATPLAAAAPQLALLARQLELTATGGGGSLTVAGLRFRGCPRHGLRVLLLPDGAPPISEDGLAAAQPLDFEQSFDTASGSWTLRIAGAPAAGRLDVWCSACRAAGATEQQQQQQQDGMTGLLSSQPLPGGPGDATLVLHLRGVELPAATGTAGQDTAGLTASRRRLVQAGGGNKAQQCDPVTVGGKEYTFASCTQTDGYSNLQMTVYSSVVPDGAGSQLRIGLVASTGGGWAGFGLPDTPGMMMGASAVIVWPSGKGAEVDGFKIPDSYAEADINKARGTFKITDAAADQGPKGELRAVFTIPLPKESANKVASTPVDYIYAIGEMLPGGKPAPGLGSHAIYGPFGGAQMTVKQAKADAPAAPAPAPEDKQQEAEQEREKEQAAAAPAPQPAAEQAAGAGGAACSLQLPGAAPQAFAGCRRIVLGQTQMHLLWSSAPVAGNPAKTTLTLGLNATGAAGYVAVGFPARPGRMTGATAFLLAPSGGATSGAQLQQYYLAGERQSDVKPEDRLTTSGTQAAQLASGELVATFQLEVDTPAPASGRRLQAVLQNADGTMPLIFAAGAVLQDGTPIQHYATATDSPPLLAGDAAAAAAGGDVQGTDDEDHSSMRAAHGWLAAIGWGVLVPAGIVMARSFKDLDRTWFHLHRILQTLGFVMGTVALGLGFAMAGGWEAKDSKYAVHRNLGMACTVLGALQFSAIVWRPAKHQRFRFAWELWHHWAGRAAAVVAIANIYYGCIHMVDLGAWPWACYTAVLAVIVGISLAKDASDWLRARNRPPGTPKSARVLLPSPVKSHDVESGTPGLIRAGPTLDGMCQSGWKDSPAASEQ